MSAYNRYHVEQFRLRTFQAEFFASKGVTYGNGSRHEKIFIMAIDYTTADLSSTKPVEYRSGHGCTGNIFHKQVVDYSESYDM